MRGLTHIHRHWNRHRPLIIGWVLLLLILLGWIAAHQWIIAQNHFTEESLRQKQHIEQALRVQENILQTLAQLAGPADLFQQQQIRATMTPLIAPYPQIRAVLLFPTLPAEGANQPEKGEGSPNTSPILLYHPAHSSDPYTLLNQDAQQISALKGTIHATSQSGAHSSLPYAMDDRPHYFLIQRATRPIQEEDRPFPWYSELHVGLLIDPATLIPSSDRYLTTLSLYNPIHKSERPLTVKGGNSVDAAPSSLTTIPLNYQSRLDSISQPFLIELTATTRILELSSFHWFALGSLSIIYFVIAQYRLNQREQLQQQQMSSERRLVLQTQNRIRMLNAISHDLRTPLTRLQLRISTLLSGDPQQRSLADIGEIQQLVDHSLGYLRGEELQESPEIIDINQLMNEIQQEMSEAGHSLPIQGEAHWRYLCQPLQLRRAVQNLINNALHYAEQVALFIEDGEQQLTIRITDNGPGIDAELLEKVTTPYYRVDSSRNRQSGGVGLGLAIVQEVTESHGGKLRLENRPEGGLSAAIILPR